MRAKKLTIGCPVFQRAWCLPLWFDCIDAQKFPVDEIDFCFAYSKSYDGTFDILENRARPYSDLRIYQFDLPTYPDRDLTRLSTLAQLRNALLEMVKETDADYFLSFDNDILFQPETMHRMFDVCDSGSAVGALIDMGGNDELMGHPSVMHFPQVLGELAYRKPFKEYDWSKPFECEVIMAVKLMGRDVYENTSYSYDIVGEDIAWSRNAADQGFKRLIHPDVRGIHLYDQDHSVEIMKTFPQLEYPDIIAKLSNWWKPREQW